MFLDLQATAQIREWVPYDCRRLNSHCGVGVCQSTNGTCDCNAGSPSIPGFDGFDCRLETSRIQNGGCLGIGGCKNGGICYNNAQTGVDTCYCSTTFTGDDCTQKRVDVTVCNDTHFGIYIKPHVDGIFNGAISIINELPFNQEELLRTEGCVGVFQPSDQSYQILTTLDTTEGGTNPCSTALQLSNITDGEQFVYKVRVTYHQTTLTGFDETHTFTCQVTSAGATGGLVLGNDRPSLTGVTVTDSYRPAAIEFLERTGDTVSIPRTNVGVTYVGEEIFVRVFLQPNSRYTKLAVDECASHPERSHISNRTVVFLENRCPRDDALYLVDSSPGTIRENNQSVLVAIYVIKYHPNNMLYISCNVTLCTDDNIDNCDAKMCGRHLDTDGFGDGRRKRATGNADYQFVTQNSIVVDTKAQYDAIRGKGTQYIYNTAEKSCLYNPLFIFVLSAVGLLFLLSITLLVLLCYRRKRANRATKELM